MLHQLSENDLLTEGRLIVPQESEIDWMALEPDEFSQILSEQIESLDKTAFVNFSNLGTTIEAVYGNGEFTELIEEKFNIVDGGKTGREHGKVYFIDSMQKPAKAYVCGKEIVVFGKGFGIFKSVINGMGTYVDEQLLPMHSGVIDTNIGGIVFVGGHGAGKTTTSLNAMEIFDRKGLAPKLLSDDWTGAKISVGDEISVHTVDASVSLTLKMKRENGELKVFDRVPSDVLERRKMSFKPHSLYNHEVQDSTRIRAIILLAGENRDVREGNIHYPRFIIDSAYHYPYVGDQKEKHIARWRKGLIGTSVSIYSREMTIGEYLDRLSDRILSIL